MRTQAYSTPCKTGMLHRSTMDRVEISQWLLRDSEHRLIQTQLAIERTRYMIHQANKSINQIQRFLGWGENGSDSPG
jgi:hypothetical protein